MKQQTTIRAPRSKEHPYFMMSTSAAQDNRLSLEARGILAYLLSRPDDWKMHPSDLMKVGSCGRDKIKKIIAELVKFGYLIKDDEQPHDETGKFTSQNYRLYEQPLTEKPSTAEPSTENPPHTYNRDVQNTESTKKIDSAPSAAVGDVVQKPRNPTFDLIVKFGYRIALEDKAGVASVAKSAGWLASWCDGNTVKAGPRKSDGMIPGANPPLQGQELFDMLAEYHKKGIDFPNTIKPFVRYASEHRTQQRAKSRPQYEFTPPEERQREIQRLLLGEAIS